MTSLHQEDLAVEPLAFEVRKSFKPHGGQGLANPRYDETSAPGSAKVSQKIPYRQPVGLTVKDLLRDITERIRNIHRLHILFVVLSRDAASLLSRIAFFTVMHQYLSVRFFRFVR